jgi:L-ribulose-5-phosphate 3-epimerase
MQKIGFMQGRLCERVDGKIQAFPWRDWELEFPAAAAIQLRLMEWTLDQERLYENPLMTAEGQGRIRTLCQQYGISIPSLTADAFMQAPFWKFDGESRANLQRDFLAVCSACAEVGISLIVVPLVDNGRLDNLSQEHALIEFLIEQQAFIGAHNLRVVFESDFAPAELARFINRLPVGLFGINYDIGNSAASGFQPKDEFAAYGHRIVNVHVKDRPQGGTTVPLGTGSAQFDVVFCELARLEYQGNFILQTARAADDRHAQTLCRYLSMTQAWMTQAGLLEYGSHVGASIDAAAAQ